MARKPKFSMFGWALIALVTAGYLTYLFMTADLIPDVTPWIGYVDDAIVFLLAFRLGNMLGGVGR